jgi:hypothetical protein
VNAEITGEIPHIDGGQSPDTVIPTSHFRQGYAGTFRPTFTRAGGRSGHARQQSSQNVQRRGADCPAT